MAQDKSGTVNPLLREMFALGVYKRSQGRLVRQATFGAFAVTVALGVWSLYDSVRDGGLILLMTRNLVSEQNTAALEVATAIDRFAVPALVLLLGLWVSFRVVNFPRFADFLIAVEAEVNKVSWPSKGELVRSTIVVLLTIFALAFILFFYDLFWRVLLQILGVTGV